MIYVLFDFIENIGNLSCIANKYHSDNYLGGYIESLLVVTYLYITLYKWIIICCQFKHFLLQR